MGQIVPSAAEVRSELAGNWLLLTFALCAFAVISHAMNLFRPREPTDPVAVKTIAIKTRGRLGYLDLASIEWIESQGNYLALHVGGRSHLIRETLAEFRRPARSGPVHPRAQARDRGHRSDTRNPAARERRLDIDTAGRPHDSRQSQLSRDRQEALGSTSLTSAFAKGLASDLVVDRIEDLQLARAGHAVDEDRVVQVQGVAASAEGRPARQPFAVRIAALDEIRPVAGHQLRQLPIRRGPGPGFLIQVIEHVPQLGEVARSPAVVDGALPGTAVCA